MHKRLNFFLDTNVMLNKDFAEKSQNLTPEEI